MRIKWYKWLSKLSSPVHHIYLLKISKLNLMYAKRQIENLYLFCNFFFLLFLLSHCFNFSHYFIFSTSYLLLSYSHILLSIFTSFSWQSNILPTRKTSFINKLFVIAFAITRFIHFWFLFFNILLLFCFALVWKTWIVRLVVMCLFKSLSNW